MSTKTNEVSLGVAIEPLNSGQLSPAAENMAEGIFENAVAFLRGDRQTFNAYLITTDTIHAQAAARIASLLEQSDYVDNQKGLPEVNDEKWTETGNNKDYHIIRVDEVVARSGERAIRSISSFLHEGTGTQVIAQQVQVVYSSQGTSSTGQA